MNIGDPIRRAGSNGRLARMPRRVLLGALLFLLTLVSYGQAFLGTLFQLAGTAGCVKETPVAGDCGDAIALDTPSSVTVSPDGKHVYAVSVFSDAAAAFARDKATGALTQLAGTAACVSESGTAGACADGKALDVPRDVAVSPDGRHAYVVSGFSDAVAVFARDKVTGALAQLPDPDGCIVDAASPPVAGCTNTGKGLQGARSVIVSRDGKHVYVTSLNSGAVAIFARDKTSGALAQLPDPDGCIVDGTSPAVAGCTNTGRGLNFARSVALSADGKHVYVASPGSDAVAAFARNKRTGALAQLAGAAGCVSETGAGPCADGVALDGADSVAISANGRNVYVASGSPGNAVVVFDRDKSTGALSQLGGTAGCVSDDGTGGLCANGTVLAGAGAVAVSGDGKNVYVTNGSDGVVIFVRDPKTGALIQLDSQAGCVSEDGSGGSCADGTALEQPFAVKVSRDGKHVYVASQVSKAVAVFARAK